MKMTKLSLVAALAVSSAFAGGDIAPVEPVVAAPVESMTTINGKLAGYYITDDAGDNMFDPDYSQLGLAATLDVTHKFNENIAMNFSAVGFMNTNKLDASDTNGGGWGYMANDDDGAFFNIANITATYADTTFILGRQLLDTPMLGGFDWLLAPGAFEAYTAANNSFENITLVGSYVRTWRQNNSGDTWLDLTKIDDGNNWTLGAVYDDNTIDANLWYYNVDAGGAVSPDKYTQVYVDAGYSFDTVKVEAQYVNTNYSIVDDSNAYGIKATATLGAWTLMGAYDRIDDTVVGYIGRDGLYTSSWNTLALSEGDTFKIEAGAEFVGIAGTVSYAYYEYAQNNGILDEEGSEIDVILGYDITDTIDLNVVYTNTTANFTNFDDVNTLEVFANYKF